MHSGRDKKSKKGHFSSEYTMLSILEYLYVNSRKNAVSKYNIVTNTPGIRQQRADRVSLMMDSLEKNGYIISEHTSSNITFYKITQKGVDEYERWIKNFLDFARSTNIGGSGSITNELGSDDGSNRSIVL
jgi:predicted transcriptional regulator